MEDEELKKLFGQGEDNKSRSKKSVDKAEDDKKSDGAAKHASKSVPEGESNEEDSVSIIESSDKKDYRENKEAKSDKGSEDKGKDQAEDKAETAPDQKKDDKEAAEEKTVVKKESPVIHKSPVINGEEMTHKADEPFPISLRSMLLMILTLMLLILILSIAFHPFFRVKTVKINGNIAVSDDEILQEAGISYDKHLFAGVSGSLWDILTLDYGKTEQKIESENPYIENIEISVKFPSTVNIEVTERQKVAYIKVPDGYAAIDTEGTVLELESVYDESVHPLICGLDIDSVVLGKKLEAVDDSAYQKMIIVLGAVLAADNSSGSYSFFDNLIEVRILPSGNFFLTVYLPSGSELQVKLKSIDNINENMSQLCYAITEGAFEDLPNGVLDMTGEEFIYREYT